MRLIDADALIKHEVEADRMGAMLVVGKGHIINAPTIAAERRFLMRKTIHITETLAGYNVILNVNGREDERVCTLTIQGVENYINKVLEDLV